MSEAADGDHYEALGETGRKEVDQARRDPRLDRGPAAVADYWDAMAEAERVRKLAIRGARAIRDTDPIWGMRALAAGDIDNDFPAVNAETLVAMNSALDSMVEEFAPAMRDIILKAMVDEGMTRAEEIAPEAAAGLNEETRSALREAMIATNRRCAAETGKAPRKRR